MESKIISVTIGKPGGNSSKNSLRAKINLPKVWIDKMGITQENKEVIAEFDGEKITITKKD